MNRLPAFVIALVMTAAAAAGAASPAAAAPPRADGSGGAGTWTTVPLPDGTIMYVRYGAPGGVRVRSVPAPAPSAAPGRAAAAADTAALADSLVAVVREILRQELRAMGFPRPPAPPSEASTSPWPQEAPPIGRGAHGPITVIVPPSGEPAPSEPAGPRGPGEKTGAERAPAESLAVPAPTSAIPPEEPSTKPEIGVPLEVGAPDTAGLPEARETTTGMSPRVIRQAFLEPGLLRTNQILFDTGKATLLPVSREVLLTIARVLAEFPEARIEVAGYTDSRGSAAMNQRLSLQRAEAVREFLVSEGGLSADRLTARGYGESDPVASNATDTGRTLNRRVEFHVLNPEALIRER
jgi:outer membrane protein OmpA-like peptidoglycan-associated protein